MPHEQVPPHLIDKLFEEKHASKQARLFWGAVKYIVSFCALFGFFFILFNFPAYLTRINYYINPPVVQPKTPVKQPETPSETPEPPKQETVSDEKNNRITIPKIGVDAPAVWDVKPEDIISRLHDGVVQYSGTALPGQNGNVFLTGHSSNYWWDKGKFNTIFATLDKVDVGDEITLTYQNKLYRYVVDKKFVVDPSHIEVLNPIDDSIVTLMTCTPVGTTINRLIVQAKQVEPVVTKIFLPESATPPALPDRLPAVR